MYIKRSIMSLVIAMVILAASGCTHASPEEEIASSSARAAESTTSSDLQAETTTAVTAENTEDVSENDVLILYFSAANLNDVDAVSSATTLVDGVSSVEWIADIIHENVGGDIVPIIPSTDYPLEYNDAADAAKKEADNEVHPAYNPLGVDPTSYRTVYIGYPIWWYRLPMVLETIFDDYDFTGVTIIPFNTHEGSRDGGTCDMIRDREPGASVLDGIAIRGSDTGKDSAKEAIIEWLSK